MTGSRTVNNACPLCGAVGDDPPLLGRQDFSIYRCPGCGLIFQGGKCGAAAPDYDNIYPREPDLKTAIKSARRQYREIVSRLAEYARGGTGSVLEIGCSYGLLVEQFRDKGWESCGIDVCGNAVDWARRRGLNCRLSSLEDFVPGRTFDLIVMSHVLEHLPAPLAALRTVRSWLGRRGVLYISVPNVESRLLRLSRSMFIGHLKPLEHLQYFTPATLRNLLVRSGFAPATRTTGRNTLADVVNNQLRSRLVLSHRWLGFNYRSPSKDKASYNSGRRLYEKCVSYSLAHLPFGPEDREIIALARADESRPRL